MELWPHQVRAIESVQAAIADGQRRICLTSPTGAGKSACAAELIKKWLTEDLKIVAYVNRKMLLEQLSRVMNAADIEHGVRASGWKNERWLNMQVSSLQTERSRLGNEDIKWELHEADRILVDELHLNSSEGVKKIIDQHLEKPESVFLGLTATPIGIGHMVDSLIVAGKNSELRACGALVPCDHIGPDEPDMRNLKPQASGEYSEGEVKKRIMTPTIFGRVIKHYRMHNPEQKPTILFAPGVAESIWFAEQFQREGIRTAHIDGENCWIDGRSFKTSETAREDILAGSKSGDIKILTNRFVLREGLDLPWLSYGILATIFGSLQTYLQAAGRLLRASPGKTRCALQDHGGMYHRLGSVNADRIWTLNNTERTIAAAREEKLRNKATTGEQEPFRCPQCATIRASGPVCPKCGYEATKRSRPVIQIDGTLIEYKGDIYRPRVTKQQPNTHTLWKQMYFRCKNSGRTFRQGEALFKKENGYYPPRDLPFMPRDAGDWLRKVIDVPFRDLILPPRKVEVEREASLFEG